MNSQMNQDPLHSHTAVEGEGEHHEKQSVMKKVRAKARKIKGTLGSKLHNHDQEHDNDDEEEEDEELVQGPDVHGAPMYESAAPKKFPTAQEGNAGQPKANLGPNPQLGQGQDLDQHVCPGTFQPKVTDPVVPATSGYDSGVPRNVGTDHDEKLGQIKGTSGQLLGKDYNAEKREGQHVSPTNDFGKDHDEKSGQIKGTSGQLFGKDYSAEKHEGQDVSPTKDFGKVDESAAPQSYTDQGDSRGEFKVTSGKHFDADHNAPNNRPQDVSPANYETKAINPAGTDGEEAGVAPILKSFDKMDIYDEPQHKKESTTTGSPDQFPPTSDRSSHKTSTIPEETSVPESFNASTENYPQDMNVDEPAKRQSGYTGAISSAASSIANTAISAKDVVASKIGYGAKNDSGTDSQMNKRGDDVVSSGNPMASTESVREPAAQQSSYTDKISSATSAIAGTAVSAKNVVASKLGYGGDNNPTSPTASDMNKGKPTSPTTSEMNTGGENAQTGGGVTGYGRQIASTVYGKVAGVGSAVAAKVPGTGTNKNASTDFGTRTNTDLDVDRSAGVPVETGSGVAGTNNKGGVGMKGYIAEKLKPGEEHKALFEVISGALHKRGKGVDEEEKPMGEVEKKPVGVVVSDAFHKRNNDDDERERENKPMGKVTESEEVANRLGSSECEKLGKVSGSESPSGTGVVDKFKGAFTNWFGKGGETNPTQAFNDHNTPSHEAKGEQDISSVGGNNESQLEERRLQTSAN